MSADFDKIVTDYQDKVYNTCLGFLKNEEDAEDTAQEVFIQLFRSIGTFKGESEIGTWIYRIAVNKSLELIRRNRRKKRSGATSDLNDQIPASGMFYHPGN